MSRACVVCGVDFPTGTNPRRITCSNRCKARRSQAFAAVRRAEARDRLLAAVAAGDVSAAEALVEAFTASLVPPMTAEATAHASAWAAAPLRMVDATGPKRCSRCERVKPRGAFYRDPRTPDGLRAACRECVSAGVRRAQRKRRQSLAA